MLKANRFEDLRRSGQGMAIRLRDQYESWTLPIVGYHNVENALAAIACAWALGLPLSQTRMRLSSFLPTPQRSEVVQCRGLTILNDCYNANPLSVARALETLRDMEVRRKVAVMGDMLELGSYAPSAHQAIGRLASQLGIDTIMAVGTYAECIAQGVREFRENGVTTYSSVDALMRDLPSRLLPGDGILVKGSRKLNLEQVTEFLLKHYSDSEPSKAPFLPS